MEPHEITTLEPKPGPMMFVTELRQPGGDFTWINDKRVPRPRLASIHVDHRTGEYTEIYVSPAE